MKIVGGGVSKKLDKYSYPANVVTSTSIAKASRRGIDIKLYAEDLYFVRTLDEMKVYKKTIFGAGYLISDKKAREIGNITQTESEETIKFNLSEREKEIVKELEKKRKETYGKEQKKN